MSTPTSPPSAADQAALILASIDKGSTIGVVYLGVAISSMSVLSTILLIPVAEYVWIGSTELLVSKLSSTIARQRPRST